MRTQQGCRCRGRVQGTPQILTDQLTLSQPWGADYAHHITTCPPDFQTFLRPCSPIMARGNERTIQKMAADNECHYSSSSISDQYRYIVMLYTHHNYF